MADTEAVLRYGSGHAWLAGKTALLTRSLGKGRASLLGAWLDPEGMLNVAEWACRHAGLALDWGRLPEGIEVSCREATDRRIHVICNHGPEDRTLPLPFDATCVLTGKPVSGRIKLPANDLVVVREQ